MSLINKEVNDFTVQAYVDNGFKKVSKSDISENFRLASLYMNTAMKFARQNGSQVRKL